MNLHGCELYTEQGVNTKTCTVGIIMLTFLISDNLSSNMGSAYLLIVLYLVLMSGRSITVNVPVVYDVTVLDEALCDSDPFQDEDLLATLNKLHGQLSSPECSSPSNNCSGNFEDDEPLLPGCSPPTSCSEVLQCNASAVTGYHLVNTPDGMSKRIYCDFEGVHCGNTSGWMRAELNKLRSTGLCAPGLTEHTINNKTFCTLSLSYSGCNNMEFKTFGFNYTQVCGFVLGYKYNSPHAFISYGTINSAYVEGVSITHGTSPHKHIWTYAAGYKDSTTNDGNCPCNSAPSAGSSAPLFVGEDYYCESTTSTSGWQTDDPLWDGHQCGGDESPCCNHAGLPWFRKDLKEYTTDDIDVRLCLDGDSSSENVGIEHIELYVK